MNPRRRQPASDVVAANRSVLVAIGQTVARRRVHLGMTQFDLAMACSVQPSYVSAIETGSRNPTLAILIQLSASLEWKLSELFAHAGY